MTEKQLQPWQVIVSGICGLVLTIGLARFAYTPLLPSLQAQTGLNDANAGVLAAINYAGYMSGAIAVAWIDSVRLRHRLYSLGPSCRDDGANARYQSMQLQWHPTYSQRS